MINKPFRILIYLIMPIFCLFCASKDKDLVADNSEVDYLQEQLDDLEYIVNVTGRMSEDIISSHQLITSKDLYTLSIFRDICRLDKHFKVEILVESKNKYKTRPISISLN